MLDEMCGDVGQAELVQIPTVPTPRKKPRKTFGPNFHLQHGAVAELEEVDDVQEKKQRMAQKFVGQQLAFQSPVSTGSAKSASGSSGLSNEEIARTYENCLKLSADNKITIKNCFGLQLIECLQEITKSDDEKLKNDLNFQSYGTAIDASAKIYSYRVDSVHQQAYKVMSALGRMDKSKGRKGSDAIELLEDDDTELSTGQVGAAAKTKKKRKGWTGRTVETNERNLNVVGTDVQYEDDSLFRKVCSHFDEGGLSGLLLNNVHVYSDGKTVRLHSLSDPVFQSVNTENQNLDMPSFNECGMFSVEADDDQQPGPSVCPSIEEFQFTTWSSEDKVLSAEEMLLKMTGASPTRPGAFRAEVGEEEEEDGEEKTDQNEAEAPPLPMDLDDENFEPAGFEIDDDDEDNQTLAALKSSNSRSPGVSKNLATEPQEYSYFDHSKMEAYVGPSHWLIKAKKELNGAKQKKPRKSRQPKKETKIDFNDCEELALIAVKVKKNPATTIQEKTSTQGTLEEHLNYDSDRFNWLFLKPHVRVSDMMKSNSRSASPVEAEVGDYDYNNPNDSLNYVPDSQGDESHGSIPGFDIDNTCLPESTEDTGGEGSSSTVEPVALLPNPGKVEKIEIDYSKKAKKVDVRRLKRAMWTVLSEEPEDTAEGTSRRSYKEEKPSMGAEMKFSDLCAALPKKLSKSMRQNLSVPITFVCFLHMCNEKTLILEGDESLTDFKILQG